MPFCSSFHCSISLIHLLCSDPFPFHKPFYVSRVLRSSFSQPLASCVGGGVKQKVVGAPQVPCKGATFATSTSQIGPHTPTLWFGKSNWTMHLKRTLAKRPPQKCTHQRAAHLKMLSSNVTFFTSSKSAAFRAGWLTFVDWLPVLKWSLCRHVWLLLLQTVEPRNVQQFSL